jgi:hypothetical protein
MFWISRGKGISVDLCPPGTEFKAELEMQEIYCRKYL